MIVIRLNRRDFLAFLSSPALARAQSGMASRGVKPTPHGKPSGLPWHSRLTDVAVQAGLREPVIYGGVDTNAYIIEAIGCGIAFLDYDNDGWLDIFVPSGSRIQGPPSGATNRLYKNNRDGTFTDVTEHAGLKRSGWAYGVTVGDYNNDGFEDIFVTYWGQNVLYRNNGNGTFTDVTKEAGLLQPGTRWGTGCAFLDYDRDGHLDLFVSNYLVFDFKTVAPAGKYDTCNFKGVPINCGPRGLPPESHILYHNNGDGTFTDISEKAGISGRKESYGLTVVAADFDNDGWPDIYVACDSTPSLLFQNNHDGTFTEVGLERGVALNEDGQEQAGMGLGVGDFNLDGYLDILKTHFTEDTPALYLNRRAGGFQDVTIRSGLGVETRYVSWGAAIADFDNDGDLDILILNLNEPPSLLRNDVSGSNHWLKVKLIGTKSNRSAIGAQVLARYGERKQMQEVLSQAGFLSVNDLRLHFGLGSATSADLEIRWPNGGSERLERVPCDRLITVKEGAGIVAQEQFPIRNQKPRDARHEST